MAIVRRIRLALLALSLVLVSGTVGYVLLGFGLLDAVYQTVTTVTTVGFREVKPLTAAGQIFTMVLILAGVAMQWTRSAAQWGQIDNVRIGLITAGVFTFSFLAGQLWAWQQLNASGYFVTNDPATAFFYLLTALHGLHLLGGLWVWGRTTTRVLRGTEVGKVRLSVELCTVYWHYLLLVWLVLFAVLLHTHT